MFVKIFVFCLLFYVLKTKNINKQPKTQNTQNITLEHVFKSKTKNTPQNTLTNIPVFLF
jgi:hypothetical protein